jgi:lysophospholipase L1-like esterase
MEGTPPGSTTQVKVLGDPQASIDEVLVVQDFFFGRPDRPDGLTVAYAGYGGWRAVNHLHAMGDPRIPVVGGERPGYSMAGITQRIKGLDSTHYLIHLGTNDLSPGSPLTAAGFIADLEGVMDRVRQVHAHLRKPPPVFVVLGMYLTGQDGETTSRPVKEAVRAALMETANRDGTFIYLDLGAYLDSRFGLWDIDDLNPFAEEWLFDGVHLNATGAEGIGTWIWSRIEAAAECTSG